MVGRRWIAWPSIHIKAARNLVTYDPVGNRLSRSLTAPGSSTTDTYSYAATDNRLASVSGGTARTFTYDAAGNVTFDNSTGAAYSYTYNAANRMESFAINGVVQAEYGYDPQGRQIIRRLTQEQKTIHNVFDTDGNRIAEYEIDDLTGGSTLLREYVWMDGVPVAVIENDQVYFIRTDHIGRPVFATDNNGAVVWTASYLPFGGVHASTGDPMALRFPGQWFQSESGLHQNWMRDYDPTTGRYMQADPLGLVDGASVYGYARGNPLRRIDPRGLWDFALGFEGDLTGGTGVEGGFGLVWDSDANMDSGIYGSYGTSAGANVGIGLGFIWTPCDIEGASQGVDANFPLPFLPAPVGGSVSLGEDQYGCEYFGGSLGVGAGISSNVSQTGTFSLRDYVNWALRW